MFHFLRIPCSTWRHVYYSQWCTDSESATVTLQVKASPRLVGRVEEAAKREGVARAEWVRAALVAACRAAASK